MSVAIDTDVVGPAERFEFWSEALKEATPPPYPYRVQRRGTEPFWGRLTSYRLGGLQVARVSAAPFAITRDAEPASEIDGDCLSIIVQLGGRYVVNQRGRTATLLAGDITCYEHSVPYTIRALSSSDIAVYRIPMRLLGGRADLVRRNTACRIRGDAGVATVAGRFLRDLALSLERGEISQDDGALSPAVLDLVAALYRPAAQVAAVPAGHNSADVLLAAVKEYIDAHLQDRDLSVERVAVRHFISVRLLYRLFRSEGCGVAEWIRHQRLERCREDLCSPQFADQPVGMIAARWSFANPAHFSRLFRKTYGCSPREFRALREARIRPVDRLCTTV